MPESANNDPLADLPVSMPPELQTPPPLNFAPASKATETRVTMSGPASQVLALAGAQQPQQTQRAGSQFLNQRRWLDNVSNEPQCAGWRIKVRRQGPSVYQGTPLPLSVVAEIAIMSYTNLEQHVREIAGGGVYRVDVLDDNGESKRVLNITVDTATCPPRTVSLPTEAPMPMSMSGSQMFSHANPRASASPSNIAQLQQQQMEVEELRVKEQKLRAEESVLDRETAVRKKQRVLDREEREANKQTDDAFQAPLKALESRLEQVLTKPKDDGGLMLLIVDSMKSAQTTQMQFMQMMQKQQQDAAAQAQVNAQAQQQMMMQLMTTMMTAMGGAQASKTSEQIELAKMQAEAQSRMLDMMMKANGNTKMDKLFETLIANQLSSSKNSVKDTLEMLELGRRQAMEAMELRREEDDEADFKYDAKAGVLGNLGKLIFGMLGGVMRGAGGPMGIAQILAALGKNAPEQVSQSDLRTLAAQLEQTPAAQQLAIQVPQQLPLRTPTNPNPQAAPAAAAGQYSQQQAQPQPQRAQQVYPQQIPVFYEEEPLRVAAPAVAPVQVVPDMQTAAPQPVEAAVGGVLEQRVFDVVTETVEQAIEDMVAEVRAHEWPEFALSKWPKRLLDEMCAKQQIFERLELLEKNCDRDVWGRFYGLVSDPNRVMQYNAFVTELDSVVFEHTNPQTAGVA
jgi:hypothetical protein